MLHNITFTLITVMQAPKKLNFNLQAPGCLQHGEYFQEKEKRNAHVSIVTASNNFLGNLITSCAFSKAQKVGATLCHGHLTFTKIYSLVAVEEIGK